ncbi:MAG: mechanosensitive ion channel family protein [Treponema sp.]|jgi:small conductance mechanosensitive channel|nr:mechanosensitive ion channel family protein [Treponema sp.]
MDVTSTIAGLWAAHSTTLLLFLRRLLLAGLIIAAGRVLVVVLRKVINHASEGKLKLKVEATLASMLKRVVGYAAVIICTIMILDLFGINTASLIAVLGAAGVAVGIALKDTLANIAAGIVIIVQRSCRKGDYIEVAGVGGTVKEINLFTTILETPDGVYVSAPNSSVWGAPLKNYTRNNRRRMDFIVGISYGDSIDAAFAVLRNIAENEKRFLKDPAPQILVQSLGDSAVNVALRAWARGDVYWQVYWDQTKNIKERIEEAGLHIAFPQVDVHIGEAPSTG